MMDSGTRGITGELRYLAKHAGIYGAANLFARALGFIVIPVYTRYLTTAEYGTLELLELSTYVLGMFLGLGIGQAIIRFYNDTDDPQQKALVISTSLWCVVTLTVVGAALFLPSGRFASRTVFGVEEYHQFFRIVFVTLLLTLMADVPMAYFRARQASVRYSVFVSCRLLAMLGLNLLFLIGLGWGVFGLLLGSMLAHGAFAILLMALVVREVGWGFDGRLLLGMLRYGLPYVPGGLGMFVLNFADRFFLQHYAGLAAVGLYSLGYKFGMLVHMMLADPFLAIWGPRRFELARQPDAPRVFSAIFTYFILAEVSFVLGLSVLGREAFQVLTGPAFRAAYHFIPVVALGYILLGAYFNVQVGILLHRRTAYIPLIVAASAATNILLNALLIPYLGAWGAAWATLVAFLVMGAINFRVSNRLFPVPYEWHRLAKILACAGTVYAASLLVPATTWLTSVVIKLALLLSYPVLLYLTGFCSDGEVAYLRALVSRVRRAPHPAPQQDLSHEI